MLQLYDKYIVTDIETDGLLDVTKKFWCGWSYESDSLISHFIFEKKKVY